MVLGRVFGCYTHPWDECQAIATTNRMPLSNGVVPPSSPALRYGQRSAYEIAGNDRSGRNNRWGTRQGRAWPRGHPCGHQHPGLWGCRSVIAYRDKNRGNTEKAGRLRLATTRRADEKSIEQFLTQNVERGSTIRTDGWKGYSKTALAGYRHESNPGMIARHIHRTFGNLKTWLNGTHHGVDPGYLHVYLDEFVFRFNRRKTPMAAFQTLLGLASAKAPMSYEKLIQRESNG